MLTSAPNSADPRLDISQARQVLKDALRTADAREIVRWLQEHTHELARSRFFELMFSFGPLAGTLLNAVARISPAERCLLGDALGRAFALGAVRPEDVRRAVPEHWSGAAPGDEHLGLAEVLVLTGRPAMIRMYVERELEICRKPHGQDRQRIAAARMAFHALPADLQAELGLRHPELSVEPASTSAEAA
ncbi:MAG TPA: hypothetical protein VLQ79_10945 [Myxococcaceae bacterium]|nr:hypothetical protein [Myxococcaceae bacterium]